ncbi:MAG: iron ABC transporter permease [Brachymonas sp.]|nr:iron ABC transporter permease [Brachymonas sp.]
MSGAGQTSTPTVVTGTAQRRALLLLAGLLALAAGGVLAGLGIGSTGWEWPWAVIGAGGESGASAAPAADVMADASAADLSDAAAAADALRLIVWDIRLPRTLGAWLAGALLGMAGAVAQGLFRNPLADPYLLGSSSGASLGVALALVALGGTPFATALAVRIGLTGAAFAGATLAVLLTLLLARGVQHTLRLLLAGVVAGVVLGALSSLVLLARLDILQAMQSFLLGSTAFIGWDACWVMAAALLVCLLLAWLLAPALDGLALGEWTARTLGLALPQMRAGLIGVLALGTGAAVAQTGLIAFIGLVAPHLVRGLVQTRHGLLVWLSACMGGLLLLLADLLARGLMAPQELPVGVLTAVLGGSYLLWLMHRGRVGKLGAG